MMKYPDTGKFEHSYMLHKRLLTDSYEWLADNSSPGVKAWVDRQNKFTQEYLRKIGHAGAVFNRMNELARYDSVSAPILCSKSEVRFFRKKKRDEDKPVIYIKSPGREEREFINMNRYPRDESLDIFQPSWDGRYAVIGISRGGDENPRVSIVETENNTLLDDTLYAGRPMMVSWLPDNSGFYYSGFPRKDDGEKGQNFYWNTAYFHRLFTGSEDDERVFYHNSVKEYYHFIAVASDGEHLVYYRSNFDKHQVFINEISRIREPQELTEGLRADYTADIAGGKVIIYTDEFNPEGTIYITDTADLRRENWKVLAEPRDDEVIKSFSLIAGRVFVNSLSKAHTRIASYSIKGEFIADIDMPVPGSAQVQGEWSGKDVYLHLASFNMPRKIYNYNPDTNGLSLYFEPDINGFDSGNIEIKQVFFQSHDGSRVSMFIVSRRDTGGIRPALVTGYGGFGIPILPDYSAFNALWVEAGGLLAVVNLRGGGEYGKKWHEQGRLQNKQNVFDDFIHAIQWLNQKGYTRPELTAIKGGSNGGLLVGAVLVQRPDLLRVVSCGVPLLDMINYHKYSIGEIWKCEYGIAEEEKDFEYIIKYSPYQNLSPDKRYPSVFFDAGGNDARVHPVHARKMASAMQALDGEQGIFLYRENKKGGHGGSAGLSDSIKENSDLLAFLMHEIGFSYFAELDNLFDKN